MFLICKRKLELQLTLAQQKAFDWLCSICLLKLISLILSSFVDYGEVGSVRGEHLIEVGCQY